MAPPCLLVAGLLQLLQGVVGALHVSGVVLVVVELDDLRLMTGSSAA